jgi:hypothetical protein
VASPAADIGLLPEGDSLREYHVMVSEAWPDLGWEDVRQLARTGRLLRLLNCVHWEARSFLYEWIEHTMRRMRAYEQALRRSPTRAPGPRSEMTQTVDRPSRGALEHSLEAALGETDEVALKGREPNRYASTFPARSSPARSARGPSRCSASTRSPGIAVCAACRWAFGMSPPRTASRSSRRG